MSAPFDPQETGTQPRTLFELAGRTPRPVRLNEATLVLIDTQNEYLDGSLRLADVEAAGLSITRRARCLRDA